MSLNRRTFLQSSGLAAAGAALLPASGQRALGPTRDEVAAHGKTFHAAGRLGLVNVLQGTASTRTFSHGNTLPIAALPFGMAHWTLQSQAGSSWMFQPDDRRLQGIRSTHQLSPWLGDYGYATSLPFCGEVNPDAKKRASSWRP